MQMMIEACHGRCRVVSLKQTCKETFNYGWSQQNDEMMNELNCNDHFRLVLRSTVSASVAGAAGYLCHHIIECIQQG